MVMTVMIVTQTETNNGTDTNLVTDSDFGTVAGTDTGY